MSVYDDIAKDKKHQFYHFVLADKKGDLFKDRIYLERAWGEENFRNYVAFRQANGFPTYELELKDAARTDLALYYAHGIGEKDGKGLFNPPDGRSWRNANIDLKVIAKMDNRGVSLGGVVIGKNKNGSYVDPDSDSPWVLNILRVRLGDIDSLLPEDEVPAVTPGQMEMYAVRAREAEAAQEILATAKANAVTPTVKYEALVRTAEHIGGDRKKAEHFVRNAEAEETAKTVAAYDRAQAAVKFAEKIFKQKEAALQEYAPPKPIFAAQGFAAKEARANA
ncbi:MAG: hypothetical protein HY053_01570 [Proteobacteria bacterium]|nr:hypothetical protein [Pseudomonadota bacterium]